MYHYFIKRFFDILLSLLILPVLILIMIPVAIIIKLEDKGPIFYNAPRLGKDKNEFIMYKFRSMKVNAPDIRNADGTTFNSDNDMRVSKVGRILRKTSIDELPQILNVLKGDMSFVGPRPSPLGDKSIYPDEFFKKFDARPGITGYNQAVLRNQASMDQRIANDSYYVDNVSFILDIQIIIMTIVSVLKSKNINRNKEEGMVDQTNE